MNDATRVSGVESVGDFDAPVEEQIEGNGISGDAVFERSAFEKLHGDVRLANFTRGLANLVNRADVGMIERGGGAGFTLKAFEGLLVAGDAFRKKFQRDETAEARVFGFVDDAHASAAELFENAVMGDGGADHSRALAFD